MEWQPNKHHWIFIHKEVSFTLVPEALVIMNNVQKPEQNFPHYFLLFHCVLVAKFHYY